MHAHAVRRPAPGATEPIVHELAPIRCEGTWVEVRLSLRYTDDGVWRGRLLFADPALGTSRQTAEILCGATEQDLWQSVRDLRDHHLRDLYRALA
ncbi:MAG TPA: hypothetical protein VNK43_03660 [Gemmatimonadales bacterium]|nr:hypothetical protein [Gemmatimonadales bacterium]